MTWRRGRDSNPRCARRTAVFKTATFGRSVTSPGRTRRQTRAAGPGAHRRGRRHEGDHLSSWPVGGCPTAWGSRFPSTRRRSTGTIPETAWAPAYNADGQPRDGADVAETRRPAGPDRLAQGDAGQPCAESGPIRAPSCASRTWAATGSPPSPPARGWVSSPISRCATGCGPAARGPYPLRQGHRA